MVAIAFVESNDSVSNFTLINGTNSNQSSSCSLGTKEQTDIGGSDLNDANLVINNDNCVFDLGESDQVDNLNKTTCMLHKASSSNLYKQINKNKSNELQTANIKKNFYFSSNSTSGATSSDELDSASISPPNELNTNSSTSSPSINSSNFMEANKILSTSPYVSSTFLSNYNNNRNKYSYYPKTRSETINQRSLSDIFGRTFISGSFRFFF